MKIKKGYKCDNCGIVEDEPQFTLQRWGYPKIDNLHFCSLHCLIVWAVNQGD